MSQLQLNINAVISFLCVLMSLHLFCQRSWLHLSLKLLAACFLAVGLQALFLALNLSGYTNAISAVLQPAMAIFYALQQAPIFDWLYTTINTDSEKTLDDDEMRVLESIINSFERLIEDSTVYTEEVTANC